ncbi:MAG: rhamnulokinase [Planctomycetes bacterium]|nr:rhamnulokinase [Planctomycetota bacterium]
MHTYYMAIDVGASSGRHILGWLEDGVIRLEEVHRFTNGPVKRDTCMAWDVDHIRKEMIAGLRKAGDIGKRPDSLGVDTWGVDFALLDKDDQVLGDVVCYRDRRTRGMMDEVFARMPVEELYARTGIQIMYINTVFHLMAVKLGQPELLAQARTCLMMPNFLSFLLSGVKKNEYTMASTSQLVNAETGMWDEEIFIRLGFPLDAFPALEMPGTPAGSLTPSIKAAVGYDCRVMLPPSHDTASAVLALPAVDDESIYISSGTWSLMGIERLRPDCRDICRLAGFANEGGYARRYRFLKNIMGLWVIQNLKKEIAPDVDYDTLARMARAGMDFTGTIDVNGPEFLMPDSMKDTVVAVARKELGVAPKTDEQILAVGYRSIAESYAATARAVEALSGKTFSRVHIMGGGSQDRLLNQLTVEATGRDIYIGPVEATAVGNILSQMLADGVFPDMQSARRAVASSFKVERVEV